MSNDDSPARPLSMQCPTEGSTGHGLVQLAHGEGGRVSRRLIREHILRPLTKANVAPTTLDDAAQPPNLQGPIAITTDCFVVSPLFFPGGDIGTLSVYGTVNDLAVSGATPRYLTLSIILEEGLSLATLDRVMASIASAAQRTGVQIVCGDTKVVTRGAADGVFLATTGVGEYLRTPPEGPGRLRAGDELVVSGNIGQHGLAVLCARERLRLTPPPKSDCAPLVDAAAALLTEPALVVRAMRDATRGGVTAVLHEWSDACELTLSINEQAMPISDNVRGASELLGLDPLHVANEGTLVAAVAAGSGAAAVQALQRAGHANAAVFGCVRERGSVPVTVIRALGREQPLDAPHGAPLPRIC